MSKTIDNKQFMEWVDQFINDTISTENAERLLKCVQENPERLDELCSQLQIDRLLEIINKQEQMSSIAETVLKRVNGKASASDLKSVRRSKVILKVAASIAILIGLGSVVMPRLAGRPGKTTEAKRQTIMEAEEVSRPRLHDEGKEVERIQAVEDRFADSDSAPVVPAKKLKAMKPVPEPAAAATPLPEPVPMPVPAAAVQQEQVAESAAPKWKVSKSEMPADKGQTQGVSDYFGGIGFAACEPMPVQRSRENYAPITENEFKNTADQSLSTFSIDVDTASYANIRRFLNRGSLPPVDAVRLEEMINYFEYAYKGPDGEDPFSTAMALTACPWNKNHQLLRVGLQGQKINKDEQKNSNLVFLFDVSGSMNSPDKLPLLKRGFEKMVHELGEKDRVAIVVYAGSSGVVLDSTSAMNKETIIGAMNRLRAGGSTAGGQGIELAYRLAADHFIKGGINRVILATDGDFNVGVSNIDDLQKLIEQKRKTGVFLSVLGFGSGNLQDAKMEMLANKGNGNYFYIDSEREAEKVLVKQLTANMVTIAKDVKIQVEFNPALVRSYRLIGYENRLMAAKDFNDDTKDAGEIGAGHQVTALYEIVPVGAPATEDGVPLKYTKPEEPVEADSTELLTLKLRYKQPEGSTSKLLNFTLNKEAYQDSMDESFRWATSVAAFGMHLRSSGQVGSFNMNEVLELARSAVGEDVDGYRNECVELMKKAMQLKSGSPNSGTYPQWQYRN